MPNKSTSGFSFVVYLLFILLACISVTIPQMLLHGIFIVWFVLAMTSGVFNKIKGTISLLIFLAFVLASSIRWGSTTALGRILIIMEKCSPIVAFFMYKNDVKKIGAIVIVLLMVLVYNEVMAFSNLSSFMTSGLRHTLSSDADYEQEIFKNGFSMAYSLAMIIPVFVYSLIHHKRWSSRGGKHTWLFVFILFFSLAFFAFVYFSMFMTALLIVLLGTALAFIYEKKNWAIKSAVVIGLFFLLFMGFYDSIMNAVSTGSATSTFFTSRLEEIHSTLSGEMVEASDISSRRDLSLMSLNTFFKHPLFGVYHQLSSFDQYRAAGIGNHAEWFDMLGLYGLFSLFYWVFLYHGIVEQKKHSKVVLHLYLFLLLGFLNPILSTFTNICVFMFVPFFLFFMFGENYEIKTGA